MFDSSKASWSNPRLILVVFLVFLSGAVAGAVAMRLGAQKFREPVTPAYYTIDGKKIALAELTKKLELSPAQAQQLETILDDFVMYVQMLQSQMDDVRANGKVRIMSILNEQQKSKFEKMVGGLQARR